MERTNELELMFKMRNFVTDAKGWTRGFTFITIENGDLKISHTIRGSVGKLTKIELEDLDVWIKYFDRI